MTEVQRLAALDRDYWSRLLMVVAWYFEERERILTVKPSRSPSGSTPKPEK